MTETRPVLPVAAADLTPDAPLSWALFDSDGAPLMPAVVTLDADALAFLFARFAPERHVANDAMSDEAVTRLKAALFDWSMPR